MRSKGGVHVLELLLDSGSDGSFLLKYGVYINGGGGGGGLVLMVVHGREGARCDGGWW